MFQQSECLVIKGLVFGIPDSKLEEAFSRISVIIVSKNIRYVCWDGDKYTYDGPNKTQRTNSFTLILPRLADKFPYLQFIYFKKTGKALGLVTGEGQIEQDNFGNYLGPFPFLNQINTVIIPSDGHEISYYLNSMNNIHIGVELSGEMKWYELGLKGLKWIKNTLNVSHVSYVVVGLGNAVTKELEKIKETPCEFPTGISQDEALIINVTR